MKTKFDRFALLDCLIKLRDQLKMAIALDDPGLVDHVRQVMIESIMHTYEVNYVTAVARFNDVVNGIDHIDTVIGVPGQ